MSVGWAKVTSTQSGEAPYVPLTQPLPSARLTTAGSDNATANNPRNVTMRIGERGDVSRISEGHSVKSEVETSVDELG